VFPQDLTYGYYSLKKKHGNPKKPLDWAVVEATAVTEEGYIVPGMFFSLSISYIQP
jgi:acetyl-CoA hydrolase